MAEPVSNEQLIRWLRGLAEAAVTAAGSRATFVSDMHFEAAERIEKLDAVLKETLSQIQDIRKTFGAPGDYGYDTETGKALYAIYQILPKLMSAVDEKPKTAKAHPDKCECAACWQAMEAGSKR